MKKLVFFTIIILAFLLSGCNFPGFQTDGGLDPDVAMATEIARILTGTPVQIDATPTPIDEEIDEPEIPEEIETEQPPEPTPLPPEPTATAEAEEPADTATPPPADAAATPTATLTTSDPTRNLGDPDWIDKMDNGDNWVLGSDAFTQIKFEDGFMKLTSVHPTDNGWRVTRPVISNFYLETSLKTPACEGSDQFGLFFRVPADSGASKGYLFGITCDGRYSLRRWDGSVMHSLIAPTAYPAINKGPNVDNKLGVMARGADLAFYINGEKIQEVTDSNYLQGKFGIFVGGGSANNLTVWVDQIRYWENP